MQCCTGGICCYVCDTLNILRTVYAQRTCWSRVFLRHSLVYTPCLSPISIICVAKSTLRALTGSPICVWHSLHSWICNNMCAAKSSLEALAGSPVCVAQSSITALQSWISSMCVEQSTLRACLGFSLCVHRKLWVGGGLGVGVGWGGGVTGREHETE